MEVMQKPQRNKAKKKKQRQVEEEDEREDIQQHQSEQPAQQYHTQHTTHIPQIQQPAAHQTTPSSLKQNKPTERHEETTGYEQPLAKDSYGGLHRLLEEPITEEITLIYPSLVEPAQTTNSPQHTMPLFTHPAHITTPAQQVATSPPRTVAPLPRTITPPPRPVTPPPRIITPPQTVVSPPRTVTPPPQTQAPKPITIQKPPTPSYFSSLAMGDQTFLPSSTYTPPPPIQTQTSPPQLSMSVPTAKILEHTKGNKTMDAAPTYNYATTKGYSTMYNIPAYASPVTVNEPTYMGLYTTAQVETHQPEISDRTAVGEISFFHPLKQESEFFNMVKRYYATQKELDAIEPYSQDLRSKCQYAEAWKFVEHSRALEVQCRDQVKVAHTFAWKEGMLDQEVYGRLKADMEALRILCGEKLTGQLFDAQMAKLTIEMFIDDFLWHSQFDNSFRVGLDDAAPQEPLFVSNYNGDFSKLEHMADVLFCFAFCFHSSVFFPSNHRYLEVFCDDVKRWLQKVAGVYLRVCSMQDEIRLLQHVLNCPGIGEWGSHVIYFSDEWNYKQAEHFYNMLTKFLSPWPISPPNFLTDFGQEALISEAEKTKQILLSNNISPSTGQKLLLTEEDYVAVLEQFPFFSFYKYIFDIRNYYAPHETEQTFATARRILEVLTNALDAFVHFPHLCKTLASCIVRILRFADIYYLHRKENMREDASELEQHYFILFTTVVSIFVSKGIKNGLWQFLSNLPYSSLNQAASLNVLSILLGRSAEASKVTSKRQWDELIHTDKSIMEVFVHTLATYEGTEYLLHAVAAWGMNSKDDLALAVQEVVFLVGYVMPQTKAKFYKDAREMIVGLCDKVSGSLSDNILPLLSTHFQEVGKSLTLYLLKGLTWNIYHPSTNDLFILKTWLMRPMKSDEFLTANFILEQVNWGLASHQKGVPWWDSSTDPRLFFLAAMQREFAFGLIEVWEAHTKKNQAVLFSPSKEEIEAWCMNKLLYFNFYAPNGEPYLEPLQISDVRIAHLRKYYDDTTHAVPPIIGYTLIMTVGLTFKGLSILKGLVTSQQFAVLLRILHDVIPDLVRQNDPLVHEITPFVEIVTELFKSPGSFFGGANPKITPNAVQFAAMVIVQLLVQTPNPSRNTTHDLGLGIAKFWVSVLTSVPQWIQNDNCKYVLNRILAITFCHKIPLQFVDFLTSPRSTSFWKNSSNARPSSFVEDYVWLAFEILYAEAVMELKPASSHHHALKEPVSYEMARCIIALQSENILAPIFLQLFFSVFFEELNHKDNKLHPTKLISPKSSLRKDLLTYLDKLSNYHKSQHQIALYHEANPIDDQFTLINDTTNSTLPTNRSTAKNNSTNNDKTSKNRSSGTVSNSQLSSRNLANIATNIKPNPAPTETPSVPHTLLARIYDFMATSWLATTASNDMAMFKAQPHLINNIQDTEAVKRLRSVLMESPIYVRFSYWVDLVDMKTIHLQFLRNHYVSNFAKQYPDTFGNSEEVPAKIPQKSRQIDLVDVFKNAPPALITRPLVTPISLQNRELENTLKKTISNIGVIAHKYQDRLNIHTTLDKHYLDLLPALYTSNPQTLQSDKACSANCTGMASFSMQATPAVIDDRILNAIKHNREQILPYIENPEISIELCANIIFLQCMGKRSLAYFAPHQKDSPEKGKLVEVLLGVFFHLVETCDERAMLVFPPTKTTLRPLIKDLADNLRTLHPQFSVRFLGCIVANPDRVLWLHPYWVPVFSSFDELCELVTRHFLRVPLIDTERLVMPILSKFDFIQWLQVNPTIAQVRRVLSILGTAVAAQNGTKFGPQLTQNPGWTYLHHAFKITCGHKLFDVYMDILNMLLNGSKTNTIPPEVWWGFLELPLSTSLSDSQIMATFEILSKFFWDLRAPKQNQTVNLYTTLFPYVPPFVEFTKKLLSSRFTSANPLFVGNGIMEVYEPWVARADPSYPHAPSSDVFPWVPQQATEAHLVVSGLVECISVLVDAYPQTFDNFVGFFLSKMAPYRTAEILNLPWYKWYISSTSLLLLLSAIQAAPSSFLIEGQGTPLGLPYLLCEVISMIDWNVSLSRAENQLQFLVNFLRLVIFSVIQHPNPFDAKFGLFLSQIHTFNWTLLTSEAYENIVSDFLGIVQNQHSSMQNFSATRGPQSRAIEIQKWGFLLHLLRSVAYVDFKTQDPQQILSISEKFCGFVQVIVYLLGLPNFDYWKGNDPFVALRDIMGTMKIRFKLLVQIPEGAACIAKTLRTFLGINNLPVANERLRDSTAVSCDMLREVPYLSIEFLRAAHQTIFSVHSLAILVEHSLEVYFGLFVPPGPLLDTLSVPELENREFVAECVKFGLTYTLYIYCLQQIKRHAPLKMLCSSVWEWECNIPVETLGEKCYKMLPLWAKSASLIYCLYRETNDKRLIEQINTLALKINKFGEDKKTDGFLGSIGFGGRSTFLPAFRFIAKALSVFLTLQAHPADNSLAFRAAHQPLRALAQFTRTHPHLDKAHAFVTGGAARDKEYAATQGMTQALACVARFFADGAKTMENVEEFVGVLGEALYPNAKIFVHMKGG